jgi:hypothetical protein
MEMAVEAVLMERAALEATLVLVVAQELIKVQVAVEVVEVLVRLDLLLLPQTMLLAVLAVMVLQIV